VTLSIWRAGETMELSVTLGSVPREVEIDKYRKVLYEQFGLAIRDSEDGPVVALVEDESSASRGGLEAGDVLASIGGTTPNTAEAAVATLIEKGLFSGRAVKITVRGQEVSTGEGAESVQRREVTLRSTR